MKQQKSGIYKASNVTFDPSKIEAISYGWWKFVIVCEGKVVFNNFRYSNTTARHQWKVRRLMQDLGISIDIEAPFAQGLQSLSLEELILEAEKNLCEMFLNEESKKIKRSENAKVRREKQKDLDRHASFLNGMTSPQLLLVKES